MLIQDDPAKAQPTFGKQAETSVKPQLLQTEQFSIQCGAQRHTRLAKH